MEEEGEGTTGEGDETSGDGDGSSGGDGDGTSGDGDGDGDGDGTSGDGDGTSGDGDGSSGDGDGSSGDGDGTGGDGDGDGALLPVLSCPNPTPCTIVDIEWEDPLAGGGWSADATCMFEALRDADVGEARQIDYGRSLLFDSPTEIRVHTDGSTRMILRQAWGHWNGIGPWVDAVEGCTLAPASYFQGCLDTPETSCLQDSNWFTGCAPAPDVCPS
jgi:hypothetical protein